MTAVIYARYSSDNQREESIEGQIRECTAYAEKNGITIIKHYIDRAISAKTDNRPEFQQMIKDSDKKLSQSGKNFQELKICGHGTILALTSYAQIRFSVIVSKLLRRTSSKKLLSSKVVVLTVSTTAFLFYI